MQSSRATDLPIEKFVECFYQKLVGQKLEEEFKIDITCTERIMQVQNFLYLQLMEFDERWNSFGRFRVVIFDSLCDRKGFERSSKNNPMKVSAVINGQKSN